jgi:MFS family permease
MGIRWLAVMFLFVGGVLTIWAYAGVWLASENVSAAAAATILSSSLAGQAIGAFAACLIPNSRHDRRRLMASTLLLLLSAGAWFAKPSSAVAAAGFGIWWLSSVPILSSILSEVDPRRAALPFAPAAQLAGIAIIPTAAGFVFAAHNVELVLVSGCAAIALSLLLGFAQHPRKIINSLLKRRRGASTQE